MKRRDFITNVTLATILTSCGREIAPSGSPRSLWTPEVVMYDCHAMATYFDGGLGPKTGIIKVDYLLKNEPLTLQFWHGHGGKNHTFQLTPELFAEMKKLKKVWITTDNVQGHTHKLFVDFSDPKWRVAGAQPIPVPL